MDNNNAERRRVQMNDTGEWREWAKHVLAELERLNHCYENLDERLRKVNDTVTALRVQSSAWGALGGAIGGIFCSVIVGIILHTVTK